MDQSRLVLLRGYLFVGGIILIAVVLFYAGRLAQKMEDEVHSVSSLFAQFAANTALTVASEDPAMRQVYQDVIRQINFPIILTDHEGRPRAWRHVGVDSDAVTDHEIQSLEPEAPPESGPIAVLLNELVELDEQNDPIPIRHAVTGELFGHVHFGESSLARELRLFPFLELAIVFIFIFLGVLGYRSIKESEQRSVWVGMAKETAHQLGTPISSLMGWVELLRDRLSQKTDGKVTLEADFAEDVLREMDSDAERLEKIAARFSNVGSVPRLNVQDVVPVVGEAVGYLRRRIPQMGAHVEIVERFQEVPPINVNRELLEWVVENLLKNALDAVDKENGEIIVEVRREPQTESVDIRVSDNGRGMTVAEQRRVFDPGYSTKRRGWGLGLSLSKRIIREYHGGRIFLHKSSPEKGTSFIIRFPL